MKIQFTIPGAPVPKARPRFRLVKPRGKEPFVHTYTDSETVKYEDRVRALASAAMAGMPPSAAPIEVLMEIRVPIPTSWSKKKQVAAAAGAVRATKRSDIDNYVKSVLDACNEVCWVDDGQIVVLTARKMYSAEPCVVVAIRQAEGEAA